MLKQGNRNNVINYIFCMSTILLKPKICCEYRIDEEPLARWFVCNMPSIAGSHGYVWPQVSLSVLCVFCVWI